jgi:hypothetical protein
MILIIYFVFLFLLQYCFSKGEEKEVNLHEIAETLRGITQFSSLMEPYGLYPIFYGGRRSRGRDRMAVGFTITISVKSWRCFIGGGNRRTRRKPPTCSKSLTNLDFLR